MSAIARMTGGLAALALAGSSLLAFTTTAHAEAITSPADSLEACTAAGGVFSQTETANLCTVTGSTQSYVVGNHPQQKWQVELTAVTTTVYTKETTSEPPTVTGCWNSGGQPMDPSQKHCEPTDVPWTQ